MKAMDGFNSHAQAEGGEGRQIALPPMVYAVTMKLKDSPVRFLTNAAINNGQLKVEAESPDADNQMVSELGCNVIDLLSLIVPFICSG